MTRRLWWIGILPLALWAAPAEAQRTVNATSCERAEVQSKVNGAAAGDTVTVPAGTCTWTAAVTVPRPISLIGAGIASTRINYGGTGSDQHNFLRIAVSATNFMEVTGFWFNKPGTGVQVYDGLIYVAGPTGWKNFRFHHNRLTSWDRDWQMRIFPQIYGLIDHNTFDGLSYGIIAVGRGNTDWTASLTFGSSDWMFVEDNTFNYTAPAPPYEGVQLSVNDMYNGGRMVFRYNTMTNAGFQTHDKMRSGFPGGQAYEVYGNAIHRATNGFKGMDISSGTGVLHHNAITGTWNYGIGFRDYKTAGPKVNNGNVDVQPCNGNEPVDQNTAGQTGWRCEYQIGTHNFGASVVSVPLYIWDNTCDGTEGGCASGVQPAIVDTTVSAAPFNVSSAVHIVAGRDYVNSTATFNGTSGIGSGTIASRPAACTTGVAYWATDEGEWNRSAGADGKMYVCTATNTWTARYGATSGNTTGLPFTYPHPLQTGGTPPNASPVVTLQPRR